MDIRKTTHNSNPVITSELSHFGVNYVANRYGVSCAYGYVVNVLCCWILIAATPLWILGTRAMHFVLARAFADNIPKRLMILALYQLIYFHTHIITPPMSLIYSQRTPHSSPMRASYGVSRCFINLCISIHTVRCRNKAGNFLRDTPNRHPVAYPWGQAMGCPCAVSIDSIFPCIVVSL